MLRSEAGRSRLATTVATALGAALLVLVPPAEAQQQDASGDAASVETPIQEDEFEYQRETFDYPQRDRNPFEPVNAGVQEGPRFENLMLAGVIYSPSVGSVAVLVDRTTGARIRVREGERIGQSTVLSIRRSNVLFNVTGPNRSRQETLQVEKQNEEVQR